MHLKPHLACDIDLDNPGVFPKIGMPKIDGVRGLHIKSAHNPDGKFTGRSLKEFKNPFVARRFNHAMFAGFDGELTLGSITAPRLCSATTGFVNRKTAKPGKPTESEELSWNIFDGVGDALEGQTYLDRLLITEGAVLNLDLPYVKMVEWSWVNNLEELMLFDANCIAAGYEGSIFRDPNGMHKSGRASNKAGGKASNAYLRLKQFVDFEVMVTGLIEAMENQNEKKTNELGRSERSSHQENMVPKGMVGMIQGVALADVEYLGKVCIQKGQPVDIGPGEMTHAQRKAIWDGHCPILDQIGKVKFFPHGQKDKPRFPTWVCLRAEEDMS